MTAHTPRKDSPNDQRLHHCRTVDYHDTVNPDSLLVLVGVWTRIKTMIEDEYTDQRPTSYRFQNSLRAAIQAEAEATGRKPAAVVAAKLCQAFGIEYVARPPGRPWPERAAKKKKNRKA